MFKKILVANRGEIALRVIRASKELGIPTVAVYSTADTDSMPVRMADDSVCIGPPPSAQSYLSIFRIIAACEITGADAIHPGYGFLSENARFAEAVADHKITLIGPNPEHIATMGDKVAAKKAMRELGVPCVPGSEGSIGSVADAAAAAKEIGYPVLVKAAAGGGGRGMKIATAANQIESAFLTAQSEALAAFGSSEVYLEKLLERPRHIEIQVFGDGKGAAVHLGERDCSLQRRHQKVLEEAPAPGLSEEQRREIGRICADAAASMSYKGAGTIEFLYDGDKFSFIEMNTRLQVEHPVTEAIYGVDLVKEQIRVAAGLPLSFRQEDLRITGHSIEARINAETFPGFLPCPGKVGTFHAPGGPGVRMDSAIYSGYEIPPHYDSLLGKLIVHGADRESALAKLRCALGELIVDGVETTAPMFAELADNPDVVAGDYSIHWLPEWLETRNAKASGQGE